MQSFLNALMQCTITMSIIALALIFISPLLSKRYASKWRYYGWLIIITGFIIPFRPYFDKAMVRNSTTISSGTVIYYRLQKNNTVEGTDVNINENLQQESDWASLIGILWFVGAITTISYQMNKHRRFIKTAKRWSEEVTDDRIIAILQQQKTEINISSHIDLKLCSFVKSPMGIGFFQPIILLPTMNYSNEEFSIILKHELIHFKRKDLWYKALVLVAMAIHWFNPVIYLISREIAVQCEISCDEQALKNACAEQREQYTETIIAIVRKQLRLQTSLSTNFYGSKNGMRNRIFPSWIHQEKKRVLSLFLE